ncbi:leukocyte cysteine proteinase inhibitor 1-like [Aquarana catesbeiana]|uniref:leukocyte cysteine proteinase inhibitor 1-like n=1 Tax=Aquarana catesbeiana TaxID=8400 RepID=UPI003CCA5C45
MHQSTQIFAKMSCGAHPQQVGGLGQSRAPTKEDQAILDKVKDAFVKQSGTHPSKFRAVLVASQVVAGKNYYFKVETGANTYIHIKVFVALPHENTGPALVAFQLNKTKDEKLSTF